MPHTTVKVADAAKCKVLKGLDFDPSDLSPIEKKIQACLKPDGSKGITCEITGSGKLLKVTCKELQGDQIKAFMVRSK